MHTDDFGGSGDVFGGCRVFGGAVVVVEDVEDRLRVLLLLLLADVRRLQQAHPLLRHPLRQKRFPSEGDMNDTNL